MEEAYNPYAAPKAAIGAPANYDADDCWRKGRTLFLRVGRPLPCRCVKCNEPALVPIKARKVYWHHAAWYVLIIFWVILYVLVAMAVRRTATIYPGLCAKHTNRRNSLIGMAWLAFLASIGLFVWGASSRMAGAFVGGAVLVLTAIILGAVGSRILVPVRIDDQTIQLQGAGRPFLDSLPSM